MCGRYSVLTEDEIIEAREILKRISKRIVQEDFAYPERSSTEVFPTQSAPIIQACDDSLIFENAQWGFQKWDGSGVIINAKSETLRQKKLFSDALAAGRCVVPASEFFEWNQSEHGKPKYYVRDKDGNILFMAGLYRDTPAGREFVVITKESTGALRRIHDRMPVLLRVAQVEAWLTGALMPEDICHAEYDTAVLPCAQDPPRQSTLFD